MDSYCERCGTALVNGVCPNCGAAQTAPAYQANAGNPYSRIFATPNEKFIGALGTSYLQSFIQTGFLSKAFVAMSNKRLYFRGKFTGVATSGKTSQIVDLKDITGSEIIKSSRPGLLGFGIISLILSIIMSSACGSTQETAYIVLGIIFWTLTLVLALAYFISIKKVFRVYFAGGSFQIPTKWYSDQELDSFCKMLRAAIDPEKSQPQYT